MILERLHGRMRKEMPPANALALAGEESVSISSVPEGWYAKALAGDAVDGIGQSDFAFRDLFEDVVEFNERAAGTVSDVAVRGIGLDPLPFEISSTTEVIVGAEAATGILTYPDDVIWTNFKSSGKSDTCSDNMCCPQVDYDLLWGQISAISLNFDSLPSNPPEPLPYNIFIIIEPFLCV